jgi:hypothetical protein
MEATGTREPHKNSPIIVWRRVDDAAPPPADLKLFTTVVLVAVECGRARRHDRGPLTED